MVLDQKMHLQLRGRHQPVETAMADWPNSAEPHCNSAQVVQYRLAAVQVKRMMFW